MMNLMNGDCLELMKSIPDKSVDMILTDPPYGMSFQSNHRKEKHRKIEGDSLLEWLPVVINESFRALKDNSHAYFFCSFHNIDKFIIELKKQFNVKNIIVWEKNNTSMGDLFGDFAPKYELIIFCHKGRRILNGRRDPNIIKFNRTKNEFHPTEKPVDLLSFLISKSSSEKEVVLDCFMGSGSAGVACKKLNRKFIGIEKNENYFKIAEKRINDA